MSGENGQPLNLLNQGDKYLSDEPAKASLISSYKLKLGSAIGMGSASSIALVLIPILIKLGVLVLVFSNPYLMIGLAILGMMTFGSAACWHRIRSKANSIFLSQDADIDGAGNNLNGGIRLYSKSTSLSRSTFDVCDSPKYPEAKNPSLLNRFLS